MAVKVKQRAKPKHEPRSTRASVTFPAELYSEVERIAEQKKVSVAWVVRDSVEKYVAEQYPLFAQTKTSSERS